ncbi:MAG: ATP-dependent RecD-like DNA helicase [Thermoanaerobaculia bacterium]
MPQLSAIVDRITFHNPENGFAVLQVSVLPSRRHATVVARTPSIHVGENIEVSGEWKVDPVHGKQFDAQEIRVSLPRDPDAIEKYLGSGMINGIGPAFAHKLIRKFGADVIDVIEKTPEKLKKIPGIGPGRLRKITESWSRQRAVRDVMVFLHAHGIGPARAARIYRTYGDEAVRTIRENPYRLADDVRGIGFLTADAIAFTLGFQPDSEERGRAGVRYLLSEAMSEGHCALPREELLRRAEEQLKIPLPIAESALATEVAAGTLVIDRIGSREAVFLTAMRAAEQRIAANLRRLLNGDAPWPSIDPGAAIPWVEKKIGLELAHSQREAVGLFLRSKVMVLTGGPGVGKTTIVNAILSILGTKGIDVALGAPTGRAAKRLGESTGRTAKTLHRLLEVDPVEGRFNRDESHPLDADLVVVDESSMIDVPLMDALLRAIRSHAALLLVGDVDQLPSVGPGQVLSDVIGSGVVPVIRLREIFRQAAESRIIVNAHLVNEGVVPDLANTREDGTLSDFFFVKASDPEHAARMVVRVVAERIPERFGFQPRRDVQVLSPMRKGSVGVLALNQQLQAALNPEGANVGVVERYGNRFTVGDKVMQLVNDYERDVFNGDTGLVETVDPAAGRMDVRFDGRRVEYPFDALDALALSYATTIHKSQGSEYPAVVVPILTQHYTMLQRNLLYTAMTRGRKLVVLVGQRKAIEIAVHNDRSARRWSKLREWLCGQ